MNILLARWLTARDYGAFSVCWSVLLVLAAFHNALILEPMTVVGPANFQDRLNSYFRANTRLNWIVIATLACVGLLFAFFYRDTVVQSSLLVLAACVPGYFLLLTARRKQYVVNKPMRALFLSLIYAALVFTVISICSSAGNLTAMKGVAALGVSWFAALRLVPRDTSDMIPLVEVAREHWRYGKWVFASAILAVGASDIQTLLLSILVDLKSAGALRALMNFVLPLSQLITVFSIYALPQLSSVAKQWGPHKLLISGIRFPLAIVTLMTVYLGALVLFAPQLEHLLYSGKMEQYVKWIPLLAASAFAAGIGASFSTLLRATQNSQHVFVAGVTGSAVGIVSAWLFQRNFGIEGALWSLLAANTSSTLIIAFTYLWVLRRRHA